MSWCVARRNPPPCVDMISTSVPQPLAAVAPQPLAAVARLQSHARASSSTATAAGAWGQPPRHGGAAASGVGALARGPHFRSCRPRRGMLQVAASSSSPYSPYPFHPGEPVAWLPAAPAPPAGPLAPAAHGHRLPMPARRGLLSSGAADGTGLWPPPSSPHLLFPPVLPWPLRPPLAGARRVQPPSRGPPPLPLPACRRRAPWAWVCSRATSCSCASPPRTQWKTQVGSGGGPAAASYRAGAPPRGERRRRGCCPAPLPALPYPAAPGPV